MLVATAYVASFLTIKEDLAMAEEKKDQKPERQHIHLTMENPIQFSSSNLTESLYMDSVEMSELISDVMHQLFADFFGAKIVINPQYREPICTLYFAEDGNNNTGYHAIDRIISKNSDAEDRIKFVNRMSTTGHHQSLFKLTEDGKDLLGDIIPNYARNANNHKINWEKITQEESYIDSSIYGINNSIPLLAVVVDLNKLVRIMYGASQQIIDPDTGAVTDTVNYQYKVNVGNPINPANTGNGNTIANRWQLFIVRLNMNIANGIAAKYGLNAGNNLGITRWQ